MIRINGNSHERRNNFCIWLVERDKKTIASFYGGGSLSVALASIEGEGSKNQETYPYGKYQVKKISNTGEYTVMHHTTVISYVFGPEASSQAHNAARELNRNRLFFENWIGRAMERFVPGLD